MFSHFFYLLDSVVMICITYTGIVKHVVLLVVDVLACVTTHAFLCCYCEKVRYHLKDGTNVM